MDRGFSAKAFGILAATALLALQVSLAQQPSASDGVQPKDALEQAARMVARRDHLGTRLLLFFLDESEPVGSRLRAARALGELRYKPAIPHLAAQIDLGDPYGVIDDVSLPACIQALSIFGEEAVPHAVKGYLETSDDRRWMFLRVLVSDERTRNVAFAYTRGLLTEKEAFGEEAAGVEELLRDLVEW